MAAETRNRRTVTGSDFSLSKAQGGGDQGLKNVNLHCGTSITVTQEAHLRAASQVVLLGTQPAHLPFLPKHIWEKVLSFTDLLTCLFVGNMTAAWRFIAAESDQSMDHIIARGHLGPVQILTHHGVGPADMNTAARHGHLHLLKFLHTSSPAAVQLSERGIASAALRNHHHIIVWSFQFYPSLVSTEVMDAACMAGSLQTVTWLHKHCKLHCSQYAITLMALSGQGDILDLLHKITGDSETERPVVCDWWLL